MLKDIREDVRHQTTYITFTGVAALVHNLIF